MILAVSGSRRISGEHEQFIQDKLNAFHRSDPITKLIHGGAVGVDETAGDWARPLRIPVEVFEADWDSFGKYAGPRRNQKMIEAKPDYWLAFPLGTSKGTRDFISRAVFARIPGKIHELR